MVRLSPLSLLAVCAGAALAAPSAEQQVLSDASAQLSNKWSYTDCGAHSLSSLKQTTDRYTGLPTDPIQIQSIAVSPDPPEPGKNLTVTVVGTAVETIQVHFSTYLSRPGLTPCLGWRIC